TIRYSLKNKKKEAFASFFCLNLNPIYFGNSFITYIKPYFKGERLAFILCRVRLQQQNYW
ncbi:MAG: hypothetical protein JJU23_10420, partial [Cyclobacteriaceae bacterium]|nr:hypothetical protein [Cyclobacteriaceae bacterium]